MTVCDGGTWRKKMGIDRGLGWYSGTRPMGRTIYPNFSCSLLTVHFPLSTSSEHTAFAFEGTGRKAIPPCRTGFRAESSSRSDGPRGDDSNFRGGTHNVTATEPSFWGRCVIFALYDTEDVRLQDCPPSSHSLLGNCAGGRGNSHWMGHDRLRALDFAVHPHDQRRQQGKGTRNSTRHGALVKMWAPFFLCQSSGRNAG